MDRKPDPPDSAYSGRWVARIQGKIVGQGGTPEAARRAAGANRHKEKPQVSYMHTSWDVKFTELMPRILSLVPRGDLYLVGGAVRDSLLGRTSHDFDFAVSVDAIQLARLVAKSLDADFFVLDQEFGAARVILTRADGAHDVLDFGAIRGGSIEADLHARDFTINAIALNARDGTTLDPLKGASDLRAKTIRACAPTALTDDPIRILRAVRLAAALDFKIEHATRQAARAAAHLLTSISPERKRDELFRILSGHRVAACIRALDMLDVLAYFLPELAALRTLEQPAPHVHDAWEHTLSVMRHLEDILDLLLEEPNGDADGLQASLLSLGIGRYRHRFHAYFAERLNPGRPLRGLLQFAALYHDVGKAATQSRRADGRIQFIGHEKVGANLAVDRGGQLNLSNAEVDWIQRTIANHLRFIFLAQGMEAEGEVPSRRAVYRFFREAGPVAVGLILLGLADLRGCRDHLLEEPSWSAWVGVARHLLEHLWERPDDAIRPARLLDGHDLIKELALTPGPAVGRLLEAVREAQAAGEIADREAAMAFAKEWAGKNTGG